MMRQTPFDNIEKHRIFSNKHTYNLMIAEYNELEKKCIIEQRGNINKGEKLAKIRMPVYDITYRQFADIQIDFMKLLIIEILKGYKFIIPYIVVKIGIIRKERTIRQINWEASDKLREELIEKGEIPAQWKNKEKDKFDNPVLTNNNKWMVFFTDKWKVSLVYLPLKIIGTQGKYKHWQLLHWRAIFSKPLKVKVSQMAKTGEINADLLDRLY